MSDLIQTLPTTDNEHVPKEDITLLETLLKVPAKVPSGFNLSLINMDIVRRTALYSIVFFSFMYFDASKLVVKILPLLQETPVYIQAVLTIVFALIVLSIQLKFQK